MPSRRIPGRPGKAARDVGSRECDGPAQGNKAPRLTVVQLPAPFAWVRETLFKRQTGPPPTRRAFCVAKAARRRERFCRRAGDPPSARVSTSDYAHRRRRDQRTPVRRRLFDRLTPVQHRRPTRPRAVAASCLPLICSAAANPDGSFPPEIAVAILEPFQTLAPMERFRRHPSATSRRVHYAREQPPTYFRGMSPPPQIVQLRPRLA